MAESVLIVNGASRINGNTDILVGRIIEGAKGVGLNPTLVELRSKHISNCIGIKKARISGTSLHSRNEFKGFIEKGGRLDMPKVEEIEATIESLSDDEYARLREWFYERDWKKWDRQIEVDSESGNLDFLIKEAIDEKKQGNLKEL